MYEHATHAHMHTQGRWCANRCSGRCLVNTHTHIHIHAHTHTHTYEHVTHTICTHKVDGVKVDVQGAAS